MEKYLKENTIFCVIPTDINNAAFFEFAGYDSNSLTFKNQRKGKKFNPDETADFFSNNTNGILYFRSTIKSFNNEFLVANIPEKFEILQRRENQRIIIKENITIKDTNNEFQAKIIDLSIGGIKIETSNRLEINQKYKVYFNFDNLDLEFTFTPSRISFENNIYIISGQIFSNSPADKIELVHYCYKKQFEQSNRN